jgi:hypothetical protein
METPFFEIEFATALILIGFVVLLLVWFGWRVRKWWTAFLFNLRRRRGIKGEKNAVNLLKREGYKIIDSQVRITGKWIVDGKDREFEVRVDFLVEKNGQQLLAEVKTGLSGSITNRQTRRQLLEYASLSSIGSVLLVSMREKKIHHLTFPFLHAHP